MVSDEQNAYEVNDVNQMPSQALRDEHQRLIREITRLQAENTELRKENDRLRITQPMGRSPSYNRRCSNPACSNWVHRHNTADIPICTSCGMSGMTPEKVRTKQKEFRDQGIDFPTDNRVVLV